jgi:hypothetical protein
MSTEKEVEKIDPKKLEELKYYILKKAQENHKTKKQTDIQMVEWFLGKIREVVDRDN